jgi:cobalt/nickel transport system permease protein
VAINLGFIDRGIEAPYQILPDYTLPILGETGLSTILAGALGAAIVGVLTISSFLLLRHSKEN